MNRKQFFFVVIFWGSSLTVHSQTTVPTLQAVTTQGNTTTNSISIRNTEGLSVVTDPANAGLRIHMLKGSPVDPGVLRFNCSSNAVTSGWDFYNSVTNKSLMYIRQNPGFVGIGTANPKVRLAVNGDLLAKKVRITVNGWADFVFESSYELPSLQQLETFINQHKHLPDVPSAKEVSDNDLELGQNQAILLQKIEEMTLYLIAQEKRLKEREQYINDRQQTLADREERLAQLEAKVGNK